MLDALLDRNLSFITRWHQKPTMGFPESMAEHAGYVARLSMFLAGEYEACGGDKAIDWRKLYETALIHDDPEQITGDIPGSFKNQSPEATKTIEGWELEAAMQLFSSLSRGNWLQWRVTQYIMDRDGCIEHQIIHLADKLTALSYAHAQVQMGNRLFLPILRGVAAEVLELLDRYKWFDIIHQNDPLFRCFLRDLERGKTLTFGGDK